MQNMDVKTAAQTGILHCAYNPKTLQGFLDLEDLATVAHMVLLNPTSHTRARYELVGQNASLEDVAATIARVADALDVRCVQIPRSDVVAKGTVPAKPDSAFAVDALDRMLFYYDKRCVFRSNEAELWSDVAFMKGHSWEQQHAVLAARPRGNVVGGCRSP